MKRAFTVFIFFIFCFHSALAQDSPELTFFSDLLDTLHYCRLAMDYRIKEKIPIQQMLVDTNGAVNELVEARKIIAKYAGYENTGPMAGLAVKFLDGVDVLIHSNEDLLSKIRGISGLHPNGFSDVDFETARFRAKSNKGWERIFDSFSGLSLKLSRQEKDGLLKKMQDLFPVFLNRYEQDKKFYSQKENIERDDQALLTAALGRIKDFLVSNGS